MSHKIGIRSIAAASALATMIAMTTLATGPAAASTIEATVPEPDLWEPPASAVGSVIPEPNPPEDAPWAPPESSRFVDQQAQNRSAPVGTVAGAPGVGELPWFAFQSYPVSGDSIAKVNLANGNLLVTANDASIAVPGFGLRADRYYNGLSTLQGSLGGGWSGNQAAWDVGLDDHGSYTDFYAPNGAVLRFTSTGSGNYSSPAGSNMTLKKNGSFGDFVWTLTANQSGDKWIFSGTGYLTRTTDRNDVGEYFNYSVGRMVLAGHQNGRYITFDWNQSGTLLGQGDSAGRTTSYGYDTSGRLNKVTAYGGAITEYTYDSTGRLATIKAPSADGAGTTTLTFGYDTSHRITSLKQKTNSATWGAGTDATTTFAYSSGQTIVTDALTHATTYKFDAQGRQTSATDALGHKRSQTWNANSSVLTSTDALTPGNQTSYTFDGNNNATSASLPTGASASAVYTAGSNCPSTGGTIYQTKCTTDPAGNKSAYDYDAAGNPTKKTNTTAGAVEFQRVYESAARTTCGGYAGQLCAATDGNGKTTTYSYNSAGDLTKVTPPAPVGATFYVVDTLGRITQVTNGKNDVTGFGYDLRDRITSNTYADGAVTTTYFSNGLTKSITDGGKSLAYEYDAQGRVTKQTGPNAGLTVKTKYDKVGNLTSHEDPYGVVSYGYNTADELTSILQPGGTCPASGNPAANSGCIQFAYDNNGNETKRTFPGGATVNRTLDASGRATRITAKNSAGTVTADVGYSYTAPGTGSDRAAIQTRTAHKEQGITTGAVTTYGYDAYNRLLSAQEKAGTTATAGWTYTYDNAGNRTSQSRTGNTGGPVGSISYSYNDASQITAATGSTTTWTYDGAGNQTRNGLTGVVNGYGFRSQNTQTTGTNHSYFNDGNQFRLSSGATTFTNTPLGVTQRVTGSTTTSFIRTPEGEPVAYHASASHYYAQDALGSVIGAFSATGANEGGYSYSPYGEARSTSTGTAITSNPLRYIGGQLETGSTYKLGARYYDASLGRFTQMDPSGQEQLPYAYVGCNPVNNSDPTGLDCASAIFTGVLGAVGLVASTIGLIAGAPTLFLGGVAAVGFIASVTGVVYSVGEVINSCW